MFCLSGLGPWMRATCILCAAREKLLHCWAQSITALRPLLVLRQKSCKEIENSASEFLTEINFDAHPHEVGRATAAMREYDKHEAGFVKHASFVRHIFDVRNL